MLRFLKQWAILGFLFLVALPALPCTCIPEAGSTAKTDMKWTSIVFRGTVIRRQALPQRAEMKGRGRYAITFRVDEYWKGDPGQTVIIYGVDDGTDCLGGGGYKVGKNYLVYSSEQDVKDEVIDTFFWYGWTDVLPKGTKMLVPGSCTPGGEISAVRKSLRELGKGRVPAKE